MNKIALVSYGLKLKFFGVNQPWKENNSMEYKSLVSKNQMERKSGKTANKINIILAYMWNAGTL